MTRCAALSRNGGAAKMLLLIRLMISYMGRLCHKVAVAIRQATRGSGVILARFTICPPASSKNKLHVYTKGDMTYYVNGKEKARGEETTFEWTLDYREVIKAHRDRQNDNLSRCATYAGRVTVRNKFGEQSYDVYAAGSPTDRRSTWTMDRMIL